MSRCTDDQTKEGAVTAPSMLRAIGAVLYPDDPDPHIRLAHKLGVKVPTIKKALDGKTRSFTRKHPIFADLEHILEQREQEINQMRTALHEWREEKL
jgi:hypothetical protein